MVDEGPGAQKTCGRQGCTKCKKLAPHMGDTLQVQAVARASNICPKTRTAVRSLPGPSTREPQACVSEVHGAAGHTAWAPQASGAAAAAWVATQPVMPRS